MQRALLSGSLHVLQAYDAWEIYDELEQCMQRALLSGSLHVLQAYNAWEIYDE